MTAISGLGLWCGGVCRSVVDLAIARVWLRILRQRAAQPRIKSLRLLRGAAGGDEEILLRPDLLANESATELTIIAGRRITFVKAPVEIKHQRVQHSREQDLGGAKMAARTFVTATNPQVRDKKLPDDVVNYRHWIVLATLVVAQFGMLP